MLDIYLLNKKKRVERLDNITETPIVTQTPVVIEAPIVTQAPVVIDAPVVTQPPVAATFMETGAPVTGTPLITESPVVTEAPVLTEVSEQVPETQILEAPVEEVKPVDPLDLLKYFGVFVMILINIYAALLSWSCNKNVHIFARIVFAFFAFLFGIVYILLHLTFRDSINPCA